MRAVNRRNISPDQLKEAIKNNLGQQAYDDINFTEDEKTRILEYPDQTDVNSIRCLAGEANYRGELDYPTIKSGVWTCHIINGEIALTLHEVREAVAIIKDPENATIK